MKKLLIIASALLLMCSMVWATDTRVTTMGDNNMILLDEHNIELFPSRLFEYPDLAIAEFNNVANNANDMTRFGIHWKFGEEKPFVLGTYFHNNIAETPMYSPINAPMSNKRMDLYYARELGTFLFGFHFGLRHSSDIDDSKADMSEAGISVYSFDLGLTPDTKKWDVAIGFEMMSWTDKTTLTTGTAPNFTYTQVKNSEPAGNMHLDFRGRYFHMVDPRTTFIPHISFDYAKVEGDGFDATVVANTKDANVKYSMMMLNVGAGLQYTPSSNVLAVLDFGIMYDKTDIDTTLYAGTTDTTYESTEKNFILPYFKVGFDADVFKWMDVRFGTTSYWNNEVEENTTADTKNTKKYPENTTYVGLGFHWNKLHIDTRVNPDLFLDGFNFISGQNNNMNFMISAVYEMM